MTIGSRILVTEVALEICETPYLVLALFQHAPGFNVCRGSEGGKMCNAHDDIPEFSKEGTL